MREGYVVLIDTFDEDVLVASDNTIVLDQVKADSSTPGGPPL